jgi:hypothetical protein
MNDVTFMCDAELFMLINKKFYPIDSCKIVRCETYISKQMNGNFNKKLFNVYTEHPVSAIDDWTSIGQVFVMKQKTPKCHAYHLVYYCGCDYENEYKFREMSDDDTRFRKYYDLMVHAFLTKDPKIQATIECPLISDIFYNKPYTTVKWFDGTTTTVKSMDGDSFNKEIGLAMAISRKYYESIGLEHPRAAFKKACYKDAHDYSDHDGD